MTCDVGSALFRQSPFVPGVHGFPDAAVDPEETQRLEIFDGKRLAWLEIDVGVKHGYKFLRGINPTVRERRHKEMDKFFRSASSARFDTDQGGEERGSDVRCFQDGP
jgi:hypothetical protein